MRKLLCWILATLMVLSGLALAEAPAASGDSAAAESSTVNGSDAVRVESDVYFVIPDGARQMLVRLPVNGGSDPVCVDRGDRIDDLLPFEGGVAYLKTENNSTAIVSCGGMQLRTVYTFGTSSASCLSSYNGNLLVLIDGLLHSIEPGTQLCLRLSGSQMTDYVVDGGSAYFLSGGDRMEYTATLTGGEKISTQAGCIYSLDLNSGETTLLLKSGASDLRVQGGMLYFHNLANAYAVRTGDDTRLMGRVGSLDIAQRALGDECTEADNGFWTTDSGLVIWYSGALNVETEAGTLALYTPANDATVVSDGECLYVWEPGKPAVTQVQLNGATPVIYSGDLAKAADLSLLVADASPDPDATPAADDIGDDMDPNADGGWFEDYLDDESGSSKGSGSGSSGWPGATPISPTPTPAPTPVALDDGDESAGSSSSGGSSGSSGGTRASGSTYSVSIDYLKATGSVNVRSGPGTGYSVKTSIPSGDVVICTGKASKDTGGSTWYQIKRNGITGWVSARYAKKSSSSSSGKTSPASGKRVTEGSVNIRSGPGLTFSSKGTIGAGKTIKVTQKSVDARGVTWFKTTYNGITGWVSSRYLKKAGSSGDSSGGGSSSGKVVTEGSVTIRNKPNKTSKALGYIGAGKSVTYLGKSKKDSRGVTWYKIKYDGITGWISSRYSHRK